MSTMMRHYPMQVATVSEGDGILSATIPADTAEFLNLLTTQSHWTQCTGGDGMPFDTSYRERSALGDMGGGKFTHRAWVAYYFGQDVTWATSTPCNGPTHLKNPAKGNASGSIVIDRVDQCTTGFAFYGWDYSTMPHDKDGVDYAICYSYPKGTCEDKKQCGNPVSALGDKIQREIDWQLPGSLLRVERTYLSGAINEPSGPRDVSLGKMVGNWTFQYQQYLGFRGTQVIAYRPDNQRIAFLHAGSNYTTTLPERLTLVKGLTSYVLTLADDTVETYSLNGALQGIVARNGQTISLVYDTKNRISTVTDHFGRNLTFNYHGESNSNPVGFLSEIVLPGGAAVAYQLNSPSGLLTKVTLPDLKERSFAYVPGSETKVPLLASVTDESNAISSFAYNAQGVALSTEKLGGVDKWSFVDSRVRGIGNITQTWPNGNTVILTYGLVKGIPRLTGESQTCANCGGTSSRTNTYDANGNTESRTDYNGNRTNYAYDLTRNLETSRTEGLTAAGGNTPQTRTITTTWHPAYRIPATITEPTSVGNKVTTFGHDANGNVLSKSVAVAGVTRTWSWTYDQFGRVLTASDPRFNQSVNTYYPNDISQGTKRGMLHTVANAAGHTTTITSYNAHGQPLSIVDANGLVSDMVYDPRQRLTSRTVGGETTVYNYDGVGQLKKVTLPDNSFLEYNYDGAHRLVEIKDGLNNRVVYTLDNMGNRTSEDYADPVNVLSRTRSRVYDALNRLQKDIGGETPSSQVTQYGYDNNGNQTSTLDPLMRTTTQSYDALNRLKQVVDPFNGTAAPTKYEYDAQDNLTKVTDPKNLSTVYVYNGFNELTSQTSSDTGATAFTYDAAGNLATKTDARSVQATYSYDVLNRVSTISYPAVGSDPAETVTYTYDGTPASCPNGKGRLCSITDKTGTTTYSYDTKGRITAKSQVSQGLTRTVGYGYNSDGQHETTTLPSGKVVTYAYINNRISGVTYDGQQVVKNAGYQPFGPVNGWTWGNDSTAVPNRHVRHFDRDGRLDRIDTGPTSGVGQIDPSVIVYDAASRITDLQRLTTGNIDATKSVTYGYDHLDRLKSVTPGAGNPNVVRGYTYDGVGNRLSSTVATAVTNYGFGATSHRLNGLTGAITKSYGYDNAGNRLSDGTSTWSYGGNNRPTTIALSGVSIQAGINALGQRITKTVNGVVTHFVYDEAGRLIGEYNEAGATLREHIWFGDIPVGVVK